MFEFDFRCVVDLYQKTCKLIAEKYFAEEDLVDRCDEMISVYGEGFDLNSVLYRNRLAAAAAKFLVNQPYFKGWRYYLDEALDPFNDIFCNSMKWYDHEVEMIAMSKAFPDLWFRLDGYGEDREDIWYEVYHDGKYSRVEAQIVYPPIKDIWET